MDVSSGKLFVDTSGNVGIGTTAPRYQLTVDGTASISDDFYLGNDMLWSNRTGDLMMSSSSWIFGGDTATNSFTFEGIASLSGYMDFGTIATPSAYTGRMFYSEENNSMWVYTGGAWVEWGGGGGGGGLIGAGTENYITKWGVGGNTLTQSIILENSSEILVSGSATFDGLVSLSDEFTVASGMDIGGGDLYVDAYDGYVGIGATAPAYALDVNGTIQGTTLTDGTFSITAGAITGAPCYISIWTNNH